MFQRSTDPRNRSFMNNSLSSMEEPQTISDKKRVAICSNAGVGKLLLLSIKNIYHIDDSSMTHFDYDERKLLSMISLTFWLELTNPSTLIHSMAGHDSTTDINRKVIVITSFPDRFIRQIKMRKDIHQFIMGYRRSIHVLRWINSDPWIMKWLKQRSMIRGHLNGWWRWITFINR